VSRIYLDTGFDAGLVAELAKADPISASAIAAIAKGLLGKATAGIISRQFRYFDLIFECVTGQHTNASRNQTKTILLL